MNSKIKGCISKNLKIDWIYDEKTEKQYLGLILESKVIMTLPAKSLKSKI